MSGVLVDTSVWIDHFRNGSDALAELLGLDLAISHPLVIGEIACGTTPDRIRTLADLGRLQQTQQASVPEALTFIEREKLFGGGCGLIDILLLTSTLMTPGALIWTLDRRLGLLAERFGVGYRAARH